MKRDTPVYPLGDTDFFVDAIKGEFREVGNSRNKIPFWQMTMWDDHYDLLYNRKLKNTAIDHVDESNMVVLSVPMIKDLDPEGFSKKYGITVEEMNGKTDFEVIMNQDIYQLLLTEGYKREVTLHEHVYEVDLYSNQLHSKNGSLPSIRLSELHENWYGNLSGLYNTKTGLMVKPEYMNGLYIPEHTISIEIASSVHLDQVAFSKIYGLSIKDTLCRYPPELEMTAKVKLLCQPAIGRRVNNKQKNEVDQKKQKSGKKKGRGLK